MIGAPLPSTCTVLSHHCLLYQKGNGVVIDARYAAVYTFLLIYVHKRYLRYIDCVVLVECISRL